MQNILEDDTSHNRVPVDTDKYYTERRNMRVGLKNGNKYIISFGLKDIQSICNFLFCELSILLNCRGINLCTKV